MVSSVKTEKGISNGMLGMAFLLATELMFFSGLISAYIVNRSGTIAWPPPDQPRLPVEVTAVNTLLLLGSAGALFLSRKQLVRNNNPQRWLFVTILLGSLFLVIQGAEWVRLINFGLTTSSGLYGAFFYTIIGAHAVHALVGISILIYLLKVLMGKNSSENKISTSDTCSMYWYFVAGIWPVLYYLVYLM